MGEELEQATVQDLKGRRVAVLMTDGVEQVEYTEPRRFLEQLGVQVTLVSPKRVGEEVQGFNHDQPGDKFKVEMTVSEARPADFDALLLPGGVINPDSLRIDPDAIAFAKAFFDAGKPVASICHGPWTVIETGAARGRRMTSWPSLKTDLKNAGADWVDQEAVVDKGLVTSRNPDDIPAFNRETIKLFSGARDQRHAA